MKDINDPRHILFFEGETEWADDPALANWNLFRWAGLWVTIPQSVHHHPNLIRVEVADRPQYARMGTRIIVPVRAVLADGRRVWQPFYRSSGAATPDKSPKGTWWPTCGLYTAAYCRFRGLPESAEGFIGKYYRARDNWYRHGKDMEKIPSCWRQVAQWLAEIIPA